MQLITLLLVSSLTVMAGAAIAPGLPQIQQAFADVPNSELLVKLMLTLPGIFTAIGAPFAGMAIDRFGRKPLLFLALLIYGFAGGVAGLVLNSLLELLIARAVLGLAVAAVMTTSIALIADYYQGAQRNQVMGTQAAFMGFGGVFFLTVSGFLSEMGWRYLFVIYLLAFFVLPLVWLFLPEPPRVDSEQPVHLDQPAPSSEPPPLGLLAFIYAMNFATMLAFYLTPVHLPFYLQQFGQFSSRDIGIAIAATTLANAISSLQYGKLKARLSFIQILVVLYGLMGMGYWIVASSRSYGVLLGGQLLVGFGLGFAMPNMNAWLNAKTPVAFRGKALGGLTTSMFLGQFLCPILTQPLVDRLGFRSTYGVFTALLLGTAIVIQARILTHQAALRAKS